MKFYIKLFSLNLKSQMQYKFSLFLPVSVSGVLCIFYDEQSGILKYFHLRCKSVRQISFLCLWKEDPSSADFLYTVSAGPILSLAVFDG